MQDEMTLEFVQVIAVQDSTSVGSEHTRRLDSLAKISNKRFTSHFRVFGYSQWLCHGYNKKENSICEESCHLRLLVNTVKQIMP